MAVYSYRKPLNEKLSEIRKAHGYSQAELAAALNHYGYTIKSGAVSAWETGLSMPNTEQFLALCEIYGITDIYKEFIGPSPEEDLLSGLNDEGRQKAIDYIHLLKASGEFKEFTRTIKLFDLPASAGTGEFLDSDNYQTIVIGNEVPESADFGIRVYGDSMEPKFTTGQVVFVHRTEILENGDIGIFYLDGSAYIKKLQKNKKGVFLVSLNKKYPPIPIRDESDFHIFGRVVA